ncbi:hypothetical protein [Fulvivirga lutea]|uniref:Uncharacterized protein n=1 Tax=Fulvivirga lutea TaxID=2810512 RepID=A0A974WIB9_9BACT|nr:hypothetical protein [Fulvivirga lutea]QSE98685.1 hypothetical protein JR347_06290 [Fulvivirga lutea]
MELKRITRQLNWLKIYSIVNTAVLAGILVYLGLGGASNSGYKSLNNQDTLNISYIKAQRVDIIENDDKLAISLSNSQTSPNPTFDNIELKGVSNRNTPNIIFFDGEGDEVGGMAFSNSLNSEWQQGIRHLAFDGNHQDEVVTVSHFIKNDSISRTGFYIHQRPQIHILDALSEMGVSPNDSEDILANKISEFKKSNPKRFEEIWQLKSRVSIEKNEQDDAVINLYDGEGRVRMKLFVEKSGNAGIHFIGEDGGVVSKLK